MRFWLGCLALAAFVACGGENSDKGGGSGSDDDDDTSGSGSASGTGNSGAGSSGPSSGSGNGDDPNANDDGDCMTNAEEAAFGSNPNEVDSDADGFDDCAERDCVSDPVSAAEKCYACGWKHNDPGNLVSTGKNDGDVIGDMQLLDSCSELVSLWDFATEYHILFMTAAW